MRRGFRPSPRRRPAQSSSSRPWPEPIRRRSWHRRYRLEGTEDLTNWTTLLDNIDGTGNLLKFIDPETTALPRYFYRIILLP